METDKLNLKKEKWNSSYKNGMKYNQSANSKILDIIRTLDNKNLSILDVGCGAGELSVFLNKDGYKVTGIDISDVAIDKANILNQENNLDAKFIVGDIQDISEKFDIIICKLVYAFIEDKEIFLKKVKDVLNKDGIFIISTPIITEENKDKVLKPMICITEKDIENLKTNFLKAIITLDVKNNFGDNYIIECSN